MRNLIAAGLFCITLAPAAAMAADACDNGKKGCEATAANADPATYKPQTEHDNTPWRFDMSQDGKRMTADEFDAWMKARGVRVARGPATPATAAGGTATADAATAPAKD
jgi:hypothetical protein